MKSPVDSVETSAMPRDKSSGRSGPPIAVVDIEQGQQQPPAPLFSIPKKAPAPLFSILKKSPAQGEQPAPLFSIPTKSPAPLFALPTKSPAPSIPQQQPPAPLFALPAAQGQQQQPAPLFALPQQKKPQPAPLFVLPPQAEPQPLFSLAPKEDAQQPAPLFSLPPQEQQQPAPLFSTSPQPLFSTSPQPGAPLFSIPGDNSNNSNKSSQCVTVTASESHVHCNDDDDRSDCAVQKGRDDDSDNCSSSTSSSVSSMMGQLANRTGLMVSLIVILGVGASAAFLAIGLSGARREQTDQFERSAVDVARSIEVQFGRYVTAANYVHHFCRNRSFSRQDFRSLYEYLIEDGLDFKAVQFDPNVTRDERADYEEEARTYYAEAYPHINYRGFVGFDDGVKNGLVPTGERDFYFPIHYMEPVIGNEAAIDLDYYSHISRRRTLTHCFEYGEPAITDRLSLVSDPNAKSRCGSADVETYGVVLMHPGVNTSDPHGGVWPRDLSSIVLCIPGLLQRSTMDHDAPARVYIHDAKDSSGKVLFLGGVELRHGPNEELTYLPETELKDISGHFEYQEHLELTNKVWTITVVAGKDSHQPSITFVVLGGVLVLLASVCLGLWVHTNNQRSNKFNALKARVEGEKAALILENTRQAARAERELNDFIAHEVRNPVAAAMAACSFVKAAVNEQEPLVDPQKREDTREDVGVIYNSLQFINDLLRNMLDMHRASHKQLQVSMETVDLFHDILQSTAGMIYQRDSKVKVIVECEPIYVKSDCLRLKQVILNLSRNATKFVNEGFIKLRGYVVDNEVRLAVEDSGIGIPAEKRDLLFAKFQESLDQLSQGTGIGLYLCKNLVELMGGEISLNKEYDSGIPGNPGTSIIINLKQPPLSGVELEEDSVSQAGATMADSSNETNLTYSETELPEHLNVLFVDDDAILRKLFSRSVKRAAPGWTMREAANGESALRLLDEGNKFDIIFVDQYMASIEKQLLGTETVLEMRARGETCRLFGLSANDLENEFIAAGADGFVIKPFPTETEALRSELLRAYYGKRAYYARHVNGTS